MKNLRLCVVGNLLGRNRGYITTQGQILADLLSKEDYAVVSCSSKINRVLRWIDIIITVISNRKKIDVLILEVYSGANFFISETVGFLGQVLHLPMIFVLHGGNLPDFSRKYPRWTKRVFSRANVLVAPSTFLVRKLGHLGFQIRVVRNIVEVDNYPCQFRRQIRPRLIWMRSFHPIYNPQMALRVLHSVRNSQLDASLVMAGLDKGLEAGIKEMAAEMGLEEAVRFPGFLDHNAKIDELSKADIYLNTNRIDNMPVAVIEACSMGLPVIATAVGGLPDLIENGVNGILVSDNDADSMAKAVNSLLDDPDLTEELSKNARRLAEMSSWKSVRACWVELFAEVIKTRSQRLIGDGLSFVTSNK